MRFLRFGRGFSRRQLLSALGCSAMAWPFLRNAPSAAAQTSEPLLILFFTPNGVVRHLWGADVAADGEVSLRPWLKPLEPYKSKVTVITGLENKAASGGTHGPGMKTLWSGTSSSGDDGFGSGESIDQRIARELAPNTKYPTLELAARSPQDYTSISNLTRMIYADAGKPLDPREDPATTIDELFLGLSQAPGAPVDERLSVRRKLLTELDSELTSLTPSLASDDRRHLEALREAWSGLRRQAELDAPAGSSCAAPNKPSSASFLTTVQAQLDILALALACGLTRIASFQFSQARSPWVPEELGVGVDFHDGISHQVPQAEGLGPGGYARPDPDNPTPEQLAGFQVPIERATQVNLWLCEQVAYLAGKLAAAAGPSGRNLLEDTILCWGNELDNGNSHNLINMPFTLLGGGAGRLKTGQLLSYPALAPNGSRGTAERSHNDLLLTLAHLMGVPLSSFGDEALNRGPLSPLVA